MSSTNYAEFFEVPVDVYPTGAVFLSIMISTNLIRYVYWFSEKEHSEYHCCCRCIARWRSTYQSGQTRVAVNSLKMLKFMSLWPFLLSLTMLYQYGEEIEGDFLSFEAVNKGYWVAIRIVGHVFLCANLYLFDAHQGFRYFSVLLLFALIFLDMTSMLNHAMERYCLVNRMCHADDYYHKKDLQTIMAWRDFLSMFLNLVLCTIAVWSSFLFGVCSNNIIYLPKKEHRTITRALDVSGHRVVSSSAHKLSELDEMLSSYLKM